MSKELERRAAVMPLATEGARPLATEKNRRDEDGVPRERRRKEKKAARDLKHGCCVKES